MTWRLPSSRKGRVESHCSETGFDMSKRIFSRTRPALPARRDGVTLDDDGRGSGLFEFISHGPDYPPGQPREALTLPHDLQVDIRSNVQFLQALPQQPIVLSGDDHARLEWPLKAGYLPVNRGELDDLRTCAMTEPQFDSRQLCSARSGWSPDSGE